MPKRSAKASAAKSKVRARVEHVFAHQKAAMGLLIHTIGIKRTEAKITLANLAFNPHRLIFHETRAATGYMRPDGGKIRAPIYLLDPI